MHEVATSRRDAMRALAMIPAIIAAPAASAATQQREWLALLADERRTGADFNRWVDLQDEAYSRFYDARRAAMEAWQADWDAKSGRPYFFINARPETEEGKDRSDAGIRDYNAYYERMQAEREAIDVRARQESGLAEIGEQYNVFCDAHTAAVKAIVDYPSRNPDIIAHKMRMVLDRCGDDNGDLRPLLISIEGAAVA